LANIGQCIQRALQDGKITKALAKELEESGDPIARINDKMEFAKREKREAAVQAVRLDDAWAKIESHEEGVATGLMSLMVKDITGKAGYHNIDMRQHFYKNRYHAKLAEFLQRFRTTRLGFEQDEEGLNNIVRALYGEAVDDPDVRELSKAYSEVLEMARTDFNRMGGSIRKNERYLMPQNHDAATIQKYGKDEWLADVRNWIDRDQMTDDFGRKLTDEELEAGIAYAYDTIESHGLNKAKDFKPPPKQAKKMARKGSEKRFLYFKDADSWLAYQNKYGRGNVFQTLTGNIDMIANDVATMEIFGTNPRAAFDALMGMVESRKGLENEKALQGFYKGTPGMKKNMLEAVFKTTTGAVERGNLTGLADFMQSTRNVITASRLGKAFLSAISDEGFTAVTAGYNDLPVSKILATKVKLASGTEAAKDLQLTAVKIGLGADTWTNMANSGNRYGDVYGTGRTARAAEVVMRASGLEPWTDAGRKAFTLEYSGFLAENFNLDFDQMGAKTQRAFDTYGITREDWDTFRQSKTFDHQGARYADFTQEGGDKFHQMVMSEVDYAVPMPDARVRAITTGGQATGSIGGQAWRSVTNLKSFPITVLTSHLYRIAYQATTGDRVAYAGAMMAATTLLGAAAMQAKDVAAGREPREMDNLKFWGAAIAQGGGVGIYGDFLFSDVNRFGQGPVASVFGPTGQLVDSTIALTLGNVQQGFKGEDTNWDLEAIRWIESNTPSIWQIQPLKNAMFDQLEVMVDPAARKKQSLARKKRMREYGQGYWWAPGEATPEFLQN